MQPKLLVTACTVVCIESINWLLRHSIFHNILTIHNKRQTPPDRLLDKSTVSGTQEECQNKSIDASALLIGLRNCESWFEHRPGPPVNQQVYLTLYLLSCPQLTRIINNTIFKNTVCRQESTSIAFKLDLQNYK